MCDITRLLLLPEDIYFIDRKSVFWKRDSQHRKNVLHMSIMFVNIGQLVIVRIVLLLMTLMGTVAYVIHINRIEHMQCKLKIVIPA